MKITNYEELKERLYQDHETYILELFPELAKIVIQNKIEYKEGAFDYTKHTFFIDFSHYVINIISGSKLDDLPHIFEIAELLTDHPDEQVQNAICTCFLENITNSAANRPDIIRYELFIPLLGPRSIDYCKYWDRFTCARTPGIWSDEEWTEVEIERKKELEQQSK